MAQHIAVNRGAHRAGARVQFDTLADDARSQHRGVFNAVKRGDGDVAGAGDQAVCVGRRNHLANLQAAVAGQWVVVAVLQVVDHHIAGGADIELADRVLDGDGHIAVGPNVGQRAADHHIAAHIQRVSRQRHGGESLIRIGGRTDPAEGNTAAQQQLAGGQHADRGLGRAHQGLHLDRHIGLQAIGIKVLLTGNRGHLGGDDLLAQPTTALFLGSVGGDFLVGKVALIGVVGLLGHPVHRLARDVDHLDRRLVGGLDDGAAQRVGRIGHGLAAAELLLELPQLGVAEVGQRELHLAAGAHIAVELVGGDIAQQGFVLDQLDPAVALLHVLHEDRIGKARGEHLCDISRAEHQLRLQQRRAVGEAGLVEGRCGIGHQEVPVPANQVEAALLVNFQVGLGLGLAFGPDVVTAGLGLVGQRSVQIRHLATGHTLAGVGNAAHAIGLARRGENALQGLDAVGAIFKGKDFAFERAAVGDGDFADAVFRRVNHASGQCVLALVVDLDRGIAAGHLDLAVAGADHGAGQVDDAAGGLDVIEDDGAGVGIKVTVHRGQPRGAVADALERVAQAVGEVAALAWREVLGNGQLDVVNPALQRSIDVEVARINVDRAHRKDDGLLDHRREVGLDAVRVVGVVGVGDFLPAFALFVLLHVEVDLFGLALDRVALATDVIDVNLVTHPHRVARLDGLQTRGGLVGIARRGGRRGRIGDRVGAHRADPHKIVTGRIELEGVVGRGAGLNRAQHLATAVDHRKLVGRRCTP